MAARDVPHNPPREDAAATTRRSGDPDVSGEISERYRPLPTGTHGLDPDVVKRDQRKRLQDALIELIAEKGYPGVRIGDLAKLAHVSPPTFYSLYCDKEDLFLSAYEEVARRTTKAVLHAYAAEDHNEAPLLMAMRAFAEIATSEPEAISLLVLGAFGAGARALEHRRRTLEELEARILVSRDRVPTSNTGDLTVKFIIGGIREVTASRLRSARQSELPAIARELAAWAASYPRQLPAGMASPPLGQASESSSDSVVPTSARAQRAEGRLPSGRSDLPRQFIVKSQRERIVDATAAIAAEKGLAALTIPEIAKRANVSYQTFYDIYASKHDAFLGAQKVGLHRALRIAGEAYDAHRDDWPSAIAAGLSALIEFLASEPAHAHLSVVDTFAASPETIEIRGASMSGFAAYLQPGYELAKRKSAVPPIAAEAITGGIWQIFHHCIENDCLADLAAATPQLVYMTLTPFLGPTQAAEIARAAAQPGSA